MRIVGICLFFSFIFITIPLLCSHKSDYMRTIELGNAEWKQRIQFLTPSQVLTMAQLITITYELLHENINLLITKLALEEKLANIQTISLTEEWHNLFNIQKSDLKPLYKDLDTLQKLQKSIHSTYQKFSTVVPELITVDQEVTQAFLHIMKEVFFAWGIKQPVLSHHKELNEHLELTMQKFDALKIILREKNEETLKSNFKTYVQIIAQAHEHADVFMEKLANTRKQYFDTFNTLLFHFFKAFYTTTFQQALKYLHAPGTTSLETQEIALLTPPELLFR